MTTGRLVNVALRDQGRLRFAWMDADLAKEGATVFHDGRALRVDVVGDRFMTMAQVLRDNSMAAVRIVAGARVHSYK